MINTSALLTNFHLHEKEGTKGGIPILTVILFLTENPSVYVNYTFDYKMVNPNFYPVKLISLDLEVAMNEVLAKARNSSGLFSRSRLDLR